MEQPDDTFSGMGMSSRYNEDPCQSQEYLAYQAVMRWRIRCLLLLLTLVVIALSIYFYFIFQEIDRIQQPSILIQSASKLPKVPTLENGG